MIDACCSIAFLFLALPFNEMYIQFIQFCINPKSNNLHSAEEIEEGDDANLAYLGYLSE